MTRPRPVLCGWIEPLFRKSAVEDPVSVADLRVEDYELLLGTMPSAEFDTVYEAYQLLADGSDGIGGWDLEDGQRRMQEFDVMNLVLRHPDRLQVVTYVMLTPEGITNLGIAGLKLERKAGCLMYMIRLPEAFAPSKPGWKGIE